MRDLTEVTRQITRNADIEYEGTMTATSPTFTTDRRWSPGSSGRNAPPEATAAYNGRWIDHGSSVDVVPDRQGYAFDDSAAYMTFRGMLTIAKPHEHVLGTPRDETYCIVTSRDAFHKMEVWVRRSAGYVYVDAWLVPIGHPDEL
jgi:hypothetical protein